MNEAKRLAITDEEKLEDIYPKIASVVMTLTERCGADGMELDYLFRLAINYLADDFINFHTVFFSEDLGEYRKLYDGLAHRNLFINFHNLMYYTPLSGRNDNSPFVKFEHIEDTSKTHSGEGTRTEIGTGNDTRNDENTVERTVIGSGESGTISEDVPLFIDDGIENPDYKMNNSTSDTSTTNETKNVTRTDTHTNNLTVNDSNSSTGGNILTFKNEKERKDFFERNQSLLELLYSLLVNPFIQEYNSII